MNKKLKILCCIFILSYSGLFSYDKNIIFFDKKNDKVQIIAPAFFRQGDQEKIKKAKTIFNSHGIKTIISKKLINGKPNLFSSPLREREQDIISAFKNKEVRILWCFRGGYGSAELIEALYKIPISEPKILIGFSDITVLHALFNQKYHLPSIHGDMVFKFLDHPNKINNILNILEGKSISIKLHGINQSSKKYNRISGEIIGGNLMVFTTLIGTKLHPKTDGKILFLEDVNEPGYRIHRALFHLKQAKLFDNIQAVIFGDFLNGDVIVKKAISNFCSTYIKDIPCFKISNVGHGETNRPLILGSHSEIHNGILKIRNPFRT